MFAKMDNIFDLKDSRERDKIAILIAISKGCETFSSIKRYLFIGYKYVESDYLLDLLGEMEIENLIVQQASSTVKALDEICYGIKFKLGDK